MISSKDNLTNARSTHDIDAFFDFSKPKTKLTHIWLVSLGILNTVVSYYIFWMYASITSNATIFSILLGVLVIFAGLLFMKRQPYYRFVVYLIGFIGIVACAFSIQYSGFYWILLILTALSLLNFMSIDLSLQRGMTPWVRKNKMTNFSQLGGSDNYEDM